MNDDPKTTSKSSTSDVIEDVISDWLCSLSEHQAVGLRGQHAAALRDAIVASLEAQLAAITTERRTPGTVEVCERCKKPPPSYVLAGYRDCLVMGINCPFRRAQHPTPSQETTDV